MGDLRCDIHELKEFQRRLETLNEGKIDAFCQECTKEIAARLWQKTIKRTPVGKSTYAQMPILGENGEPLVYKRGPKKGKVKLKRSVTHAKGTLRRGWTIGRIFFNGIQYQVELINPVEYAPYVEFGHRQTPGRYVPAIGKKLKKGWADGRFMLTISVQEMRKITPRLLEKKLNSFLEEAFHD